MASSKVMASSSPSSLANRDPPRHSSTISSSLSNLMADLHHPKNLNATSVTMDDILKNIYVDSSFAPDPPIFPKSVDDVWKEIVAGAGSSGSGSGAEQPPPAGDPKGEDHHGITLEDFLSRNVVGGGIEGSLIQPQCQPQQGQAVVVVGGGRGKRRAVPGEPPVDKATQQKQRRMIKNRESAARSRERKQAYTAELESLVAQLEEENARLLGEEVELNKERLNQLLRNLVPVGEGRRPPQRFLRKTKSTEW